MIKRCVVLVFVAGAFGCGTPMGSDDGGPSSDSGANVLDAGGGDDAGSVDAGLDAGQADAGEVDAGANDAGDVDAGGIDAGDADAGANDAGANDAGELDAGGSDAGGSDAGTSDAGGFDAGSDAGFDAGVDAGPAGFCSSSCLSPAGETCWSCWPSRPDAGGLDVTIATSERILLDENVDVGRLTIRGQLTTAPTALTVRARAIDLSGGSWVAGTAAMPHASPLHITLTGSNFPLNSRDRMIRVQQDGRLEFHGVFPTPIFSTLEAADAGTTQLTVSTSTNWRAGDEVLVTPSGHHADDASPYTMPDGGRSRTEFLQLAAASGASVTVSSPLVGTRYGVFDAGWPLDLRAQIANLTRNIVIEGEGDATWDAGTGAAIQATGNGVLVLDGVRLSRGGYGGDGTAAIELRAMADAGVQLSNNAITDVNRGVVIHLANGAVVRDNVIARVTGHAVWLLSGIEENNVLEHNLVAAVRRPSNSPTTITEFVTPGPGSSPGLCGASAFVLGAPANFVRRNVATEVAGCGYWLSFAQQPLGLAQGLDLSPRRRALGSFDDNLAHATLGMGVQMGQSIASTTSGVADSADYAPQADAHLSAPTGVLLATTFQNIRVVGSQGSGFLLAGADLTLAAPVVWNTVSLAINNTRAGLQINDGLFVPRLNAPLAQSLGDSAVMQMGFDLRAIRRSRFVNATMWSMFGFEYFGHTRIGDFSANQFSNVRVGDRVTLPAPTSFIVDGPVLDADGAGGFPGRWWVNNLPFYTQGNTCSPAPPASATSGVLCTGNYFGLAYIGAGVGTGTGTPLVPAAQLRREVTGTPVIGYPALAMGLQADYPALPVPAGETVRLEFPGYAFTPRRISFVPWSAAPGLSSVLKIAYPAGTTFSISSYYSYYPPYGAGIRTFTAASSVTEVANDALAEKYFFDGTYLYLRAKSDYRGSDVRTIFYTVWITATHPSLP